MDQHDIDCVLTIKMKDGTSYCANHIGVYWGEGGLKLGFRSTGTLTQMKLADVVGIEVSQVLDTENGTV